MFTHPSFLSDLLLLIFLLFSFFFFFVFFFFLVTCSGIRNFTFQFESRKREDMSITRRSFLSLSFGAFASIPD